MHTFGQRVGRFENKDQHHCPRCGWMYCEGDWGEGVCKADMHFSGEPTSDGDATAEYLRAWYEINRETWRDRSRFAKYGRRWEGPWADNFMLRLIGEIARIGDEKRRQLGDKPDRALVDTFERDWSRVIYDATLDRAKTQRIIELARLNGLFDPARYCATKRETP